MQMCIRDRANGAEAIARGREAESEKKRAEDNAAAARRQEKVAEQQGALAEQQRTLAQSRLGDVSSLANSMIFEIGDGLRDLSGTTATRELMVQRGVDYLNRMSEQDPGGSGMQRQMGAAWLKVAELQYDPGRSSLYDTAGARESLSRSFKLLEPLAKANPRDPDLRHQLIQACLLYTSTQATCLAPICRRAFMGACNPQRPAGRPRATLVAHTSHRRGCRQDASVPKPVRASAAL